MAKTLIGNVKGKDGRGIARIEKTGTTGSVDTYTITYTDNTTYTYTVNNSDNIPLQRQIVPSAAVESSATASQAYGAGDYVVVNGVLRKVKSAIGKGNAISDSNSTATTVTGELATIGNSVSKSVYILLYDGGNTGGKVTFYARGCMATLTVADVTGVNVGTPLKVTDIIPTEFRPDISFYNPLVHRQSNNIGQIWVPNKTCDDPYAYIYAGVAPSGNSNALYGTVSWIYTEPDDLEAN
jgi:hypothetical protein